MYFVFILKSETTNHIICVYLGNAGNESAKDHLLRIHLNSLHSSKHSAGGEI